MIAARAWPAEIEESYGNWLLRANQGVTKRANSVLTAGAMPHGENWLIEIEKFYEEKKIRPCFYITESSPAQLDHYLNKNNYKLDTKINILGVNTKKLVNKIKENSRFRVEVTDYATPLWMTAFIKLEEHDSRQREAFESIFHGIPLPKGFLAIYLLDEIVAVATIAAQSNWGYVSNVVVSKHYRRQGIASQLLLHIAKWAYQHDIKSLLMQVLAHNEPALQLYAKLGFKKLANSHYRIKAENTPEEKSH